jgi:hypothetical protein
MNFIFGALHVSAQINSWLKSSSGNWEESQWSLGALPGSGQSILVTNAGWKAVAINPATAQNFPQTLNVNSITVASPVDSYNVLLLNYAGLPTPLTTKFLTIASNSAMTMLNSALNLNGNGGEGLKIGGEFNQNESSVVSGQQIEIGTIGPGVYNLNSGTLAVNHVFVGGSFGGVFNQNGGSNGAGIVHLDPGATYSLNDGDFNATVYFNDSSGPSLLRQKGGRINSALQIFNGDYLLEGGFNFGNIVAPVSDGYCMFCGSAAVTQTGGTNFGSIQLGYWGNGYYVLSNGTSSSESVSLGSQGFFYQFGGNQVISGVLSVNGGAISGRSFGWGAYTLNGGTLSTTGMILEGFYTQNGGTNIVAGDIQIVSSLSLSPRLWITEGVLRANNTTASRGIIQSGGLQVITNQLTIDQGSSSYGQWADLEITGGQLVVSNILIRGAVFNLTAGTLTQSGIFTIGGGKLIPSNGSHQLGSLKLENYYSTSNSIIFMPPNVPSTVHFQSSSAVPWTSTATLTISNWSGSIFGGGTHQIIFGNDTNGLTSQQLSRIFFSNPAGISPGLYGARILSNGEIVPDALPTPTGRIAPVLRTIRQANRSIAITVLGESGSDYGIEVSTNFVNWTFWTNRIATNGSASFLDSANEDQKVYRAVLMP